MAKTAIAPTSVRIIGVPLDLGAGRRGVDMGPSAIRIAGVAEQLRYLGYQVQDMGDIDIRAPETQVIEDHRLKYLPEIARTVTELFSVVQQTLDNGEFPLVLGGDHSMAVGTISGVANHFARQQQRCGLVWFDAHGDANTPETTESGNIHGMPLAALFGLGAPELVGVGNFRGLRVQPNNTVVIGLRNVDTKEKAILRQIGLTVISMEHIDREGLFKVMQQAIDLVTKDTEAFHVSFDVDVLDPTVAAGVGTPARGGLTYREAHTMMEMIAESKKMCSLEIAEVNPILDNKNTTAEIAVELIASALGKKIL